jgi:O-acetyl-ADP-ribose deacetylase (regulator of RNase III)
MTPIHYVQGDATAPQGEGNKVLAHICTDRGGWGKGFVGAISRRWAEPEASFRAWYKGRAENDFALGAVQFVQVEPAFWVANMLAQHGYNPDRHGPPIRYEAVETCLKKVAEQAKALDASVHMPRIGTGLAGGKWELIEPIIARTLSENNIAVTVYDF